MKMAGTLRVFCFTLIIITTFGVTSSCGSRTHTTATATPAVNHNQNPTAYTDEFANPAQQQQQQYYNQIPINKTDYNEATIYFPTDVDILTRGGSGANAGTVQGQRRTADRPPNPITNAQFPPRLPERTSPMDAWQQQPQRPIDAFAFPAAPATVEPRPNDPITDFAWKVFKGSKTPNPIANLVLSPLLLQLTLSLLQYAAAGTTSEQLGYVTNRVSAEQLNQLAGRILAVQSRNQLGLAAAVFTDRSFGLNTSFVREANTRGVDAIAVNFGAPIDAGYTINNWIASATQNNIQNMFKADEAYGLRVLLANAIYFRGFWKNTFNQTYRDHFYTSSKLYKDAVYMSQVQLMQTNEFVCAGGAQGVWVEIPYEGREFSMVLIVPTERHQLDNLVAQMSSADVIDIINQLSFSYRREVHLKMPKFSIQSTFSVVNTLLKLGLVDLFTMNSQLPYLSTNREAVKVDDILQQAVLKVDEVGSVATVAQTVGVVTLSISDDPDKVDITVDQPFLALIVDRRNKVPLFLAKIFDP